MIGGDIVSFSSKPRWVGGRPLPSPSVSCTLEDGGISFFGTGTSLSSVSPLDTRNHITRQATKRRPPSTKAQEPPLSSLSFLRTTTGRLKIEVRKTAAQKTTEHMITKVVAPMTKPFKYSLPKLTLQKSVPHIAIYLHPRGRPLHKILTVPLIESYCKVKTLLRLPK